jgi:hypothetical protein
MFDRDIIKTFKKFMAWPPNTSDQVVFATMGNPSSIIA